MVLIKVEVNVSNDCDNNVGDRGNNSDIGGGGDGDGNSNSNNDNSGGSDGGGKCC